MGMMRRMFTTFRTSGAAWAALLIGCLLGALAAPRVLVAFAALPAAAAIFGIEQGRDLTDEELVRAEQNLGRALTYGVETANSKSQLSYLTTYRLTRVPLTSEARAELQAVRRQVEEAIQRRPLDAYLWTRYTHVSYLLDGLSPYSYAALQRSFQYGSDEMELFRFRMALCLKEWDNLPPSIRQLVRDQIAFGASQRNLWPRLLVDISEKSGQQLLVLLEEASVDIQTVKRRAARIRRKQALEESSPPTAE
ncbi:hypothetical protein QMT40_000061 [Parvibaculaceae bacterium PLY_AMNH_Bact1]|nr:hypothetical protein QMT40_000061 [Parvibaculaceae bacterium PLY_AMNH_Bact1]